MTLRLYSAVLFVSLILSLTIPVAASGAAVAGGRNGAVISLDAASLENFLGVKKGRLDGVTIVSLPDPALGEFVCEGIRVELYDYLPRAALDWLVFVPAREESVARISLLPDAAGAGGATMISLVSSDFSAAESVSIAVDLLAWRQAECGYWTHVFAWSSRQIAV